MTRARQPRRAAAPDGSWQWSKRYRIWDASRRIFVYPENWIAPEPRVSKPVQALLTDVVSFTPPDGATKAGRREARRPAAVRVLFSGATPTAALAAAQVVARDLGRDLYRIDTSAIVSRYIGDTEKQLDRVLAAARSKDAVLLFDEADALFTSRTKVKDAHDRYANIAASALLHRTERRAAPVILAARRAVGIRTGAAAGFQFVIPFRARKKVRALSSP